jgi:hypothetical protein
MAVSAGYMAVEVAAAVGVMLVAVLVLWVVKG